MILCSITGSMYIMEIVLAFCNHSILTVCLTLKTLVLSLKDDIPHSTYIEHSLEQVLQVANNGV